MTFIRPTATAQNASGEDTVSDVTLGYAWAYIEKFSGKEFGGAAQQLLAEAVFRIVIDHPMDSFTPRRADVISWGIRRLNILDSEDPDGMRRELRILAKELVA